MARRSARVVGPALAEPDAVTEVALEEALERIGELSHRLWAVRERHLPGRAWFGRQRCRGCAHRYPCETIRAAGAFRTCQRLNRL